MQLIRFWKEAIILALVITCSVMYYVCDQDCGGQPSATSSPVAIPVSKEESVKTKVTRTTLKPTGETTTEVTETERDTKEKSKVGMVTSKTGDRAKYSVGVYTNPLDYKKVSVDVGARLGDLPVSAVAGYQFGNSEVRVGLRVDF